MTHESLTFHGCAPAPLASYLKALGILRLISSDANHVSGRAADPKARGWWEDERFHIGTTLGRAALCGFFLNDYAPSPIIAPWNGRAGFLEGDAGAESSRTGAELVNAIQRSASPRFENMRRTIDSLRGNAAVSGYDRLRAKEKKLSIDLKTLKGDEKARVEDELKHVKKRSKECKSALLPALRATTDLHHLAYIDACYVLSADEAAAPLLGSGGNDGSRDFGVNFAERLRGVVRLRTWRPKGWSGRTTRSGTIRRGPTPGHDGLDGSVRPGTGRRQRYDRIRRLRPAQRMGRRVGDGGNNGVCRRFDPALGCRR